MKIKLLKKKITEIGNKLRYVWYKNRNSKFISFYIKEVNEKNCIALILQRLA